MFISVVNRIRVRHSPGGKNSDLCTVKHKIRRESSGTVLGSGLKLHFVVLISVSLIVGVIIGVMLEPAAMGLRLSGDYVDLRVALEGLIFESTSRSCSFVGRGAW